VVESKAVLLQGGVEGFFARMSEGRVADVVGESESFGELMIQVEGRSDGSRDLRYFERMGEAAPKMIAREVVGEAGEDLSLSSKTAEGPRVEDAGSVASEWSAIGMGGLRILATGKFRFIMYGDCGR